MGLRDSASPLRRFARWLSRRGERAVLAISMALCLLAAPFAVSLAEAHPLGLTRVVVTFASDRTYTIDIMVDPESLLAKLEIVSGRQPSGIVPLDQLPARIGALQEVLQAQTRVLFDEHRVTPAFAYVPGPAAAAASGQAQSQPTAPTVPTTPAPGATTPGLDVSVIAPTATASTATVRLTGIVPLGATRFRFNYGLVLGSYVLSVHSAAGGAATPVTLWIAGGQDSDPIDLTRGLVPLSRLAVARQYFVLGFEHILPKGIDHILFVIGIFLLSTAWRPILLQVTTFTIAHSITLGLTMYGLVSLPSTIVEPLIALSITYVAVENLWTSELKPWRLALVFAFGLLHGMGFAGVLRELGLPRSEFLTALFTFNLGVEGGQLAVILIALLLVGWWRQRERVRYRQLVVVPVSVLIALVGAYWTIVRALG